MSKTCFWYAEEFQLLCGDRATVSASLQQEIKDYKDGKRNKANPETTRGENGNGNGKDNDNKSGKSKSHSNKRGDGTAVKCMSAFPFVGLIMLGQLLVIPDQWLMF